ncbi:hypothetical protein QE152_g22002 [Popillia japonica]|uniref:Uncharacterized protein n=1 Tax=Popillia japonica TaxID=7064 RepID=A0AAW1KK57_POPJA
MYIRKRTNKSGATIIEYNSGIHYRINDDFKKSQTLLKRGKSVSHAILPPLQETPGISSDKGKAVNKLLQKRFGEQWIQDRNFKWYFELLLKNLMPEPVGPLETEEACHCLTKDTESKY